VIRIFIVILRSIGATLELLELELDSIDTMVWTTNYFLTIYDYHASVLSL